MTLNWGARHIGHCSPVAGASFASRASMRFFKASTSSGNAVTRFQIGTRSSASMMSPIMPMVSPPVDVLCESNHSKSGGLTTFFSEGWNG